MSCCNCLEIEILNDVPSFPDSLKDNGRILLDLPGSNIIEQYKSVEELIVDGIETEEVTDIQVPTTRRNTILAERTLGKNKVSDTERGYDCIVKDGPSIKRFIRLFFVGGGDGSRAYRVRLDYGGQHWLKRASSMFLDEIPYPIFRFNESNFNTFNARSGYVDGDEGVFFPLVNFGRFANNNNLVLEDFRPHLSKLMILQKGFCKMGWNFASPFFESTQGRKMINYILSPDYGASPTLIEQNKFQAKLDSNLKFTEEEFDNGDVFEPIGEGQFVGTGWHRFIVELRGSYWGGATNNERGLIITIAVWRPGEGWAYLDSHMEPSGAPRTGQGAKLNIRLEAETFVRPGEYVSAFINELGGGTLNISESSFSNVPIRVIPVEGQEIDLRKYIRRETFLDFFKSCIHLINGKIVTDWINKTVTLYAPWDAEYYDESIEGFYLDQIKDWTDKIIPRTEDASLGSIETNRIQVLRFKPSTDKHIGDKGLDGNDGMYSQRVDLGPDFVDDVTEIESTLFEPTLNDVMNDYRFDVAPILTNPPLIVPFMLDNTEGDLSWDIKPRVLIWAGNVKQVESSGLGRRYWRFKGSTQDRVPLAYQKAVGYVDDDVTIEIPSDSISFEPGENSHYGLFYERELKNKVFNNIHSFQAIISGYEYDITNFRHLYQGFYNGDPFFFRLLEISGKRTCSNAPVQVLARPDGFIGDTCGTSITEYVVNEAQIRIKYDPDTREIKAERVSTRISSPISVDDLSVSKDGGATFTPYTENDPVSHDGDVIFRRNVVFSDNSGSQLVEAVANINAVCYNLVGISVDYDPDTGTASASAEDDITSTIDTDNWTVSIDGASDVAYTPGTELSGFTTLFFERIVSFTDTCQSQVIQRSLEIDQAECQNRPVISWDEVGDCVYTFSIDETDVASAIRFVHFQIYNPLTDKWRDWNGSLVRGLSGTIARAKITYEDNCPDSIIEEPCPSA